MLIDILIVDDHAIVREGIQLILETTNRYRVIGEAENGQQALSFLEQQRPHCILLDLNMPILDGISFLRKLKSMDVKIPTIILTTFNESYLLAESIELGAMSYILKDTGREKLFATIEAAVRGETLLQPEMMQLLVKAQSEKSAPKLLTDKEIEVINLLAQGMKNREIADKLYISERTVKSYLTTIYSKLEVSSRTQAIAVAVEKKYI